MTKLKLDLGALRVESFEPAVAVSSTRGTIRARAESDACLRMFADTDGCSGEYCNTVAPCTGDDQCLMATLPPKCL